MYIYTESMKTVIYSGDRTKLNLKEIYNHFDLLKNLAFRDVTIRYKQTGLGILWAIVRPCFNIAVFGVISMLITKSNNTTENFLNVGAGTVIWTLISLCITSSGSSLLSNG